MHRYITVFLTKLAFCSFKVLFCDWDEDSPEFTQFSSQYYSLDVLKRCGGQWLLTLCGSVVVMRSCREGHVVRFRLLESATSERSSKKWKAQQRTAATQKLVAKLVLLLGSLVLKAPQKIEDQYNVTFIHTHHWMMAGKLGRTWVTGGLEKTGSWCH